MFFSGNPVRACIYFIYDKDGIIDEYILDQLKDMKNNVSFIHCVINGSLTPEGHSALSSIADEVYVRENKGNDIGAYKAAIKYIGWDKLFEFDELIIMNNTCFGPVYPFKEAFDWSVTVDADIWGLTIDEKSDWLGTKDHLHYNKCKYTLQSYFTAIRKPLLGSKLLRDFFDEIPEDAGYIQSGCYYEYAFPGYFEERGYKSAVYCNNFDDKHYPLLNDPISLVRDKRMPLIKKRSFFHHYSDFLNNTGGEATVRLLNFLENETDYNIGLIWRSVLRNSNLSDIVRCAQLNRVLPSGVTLLKKENRIKKVGVVYHAFYEDLFDESLEYMENFPADTDFLFTTNSAEKKQMLEKKLREHDLNGSVITIENRGRDVSSLLVGAKDFVSDHELICFAHDKKTKNIKPTSVGRSWRYKLNQNMFGTREYIENIINLFANEPFMGIAFPSPPNHGQYPYNLGDGWLGNYDNTDKLLKKFDVNVKRNRHALCVAPLGTCFWFRPAALSKLFNGMDGCGWSYNDFPHEPNRCDQTLLHAIERSYAYFAQDAGYYPVYLYNDKYAEIELTNLEFVKTGSTEMRAWVEALAMEAIGHSKSGGSDMSSEQVIAAYSPDINYGVKTSLKHLAIALRYKFPRMWKLLLPIRRLGKKILRIK